jgi:hypothetical protein
MLKSVSQVTEEVSEKKKGAAKKTVSKKTASKKTKK